jgi:hypothetical protein
MHIRGLSLKDFAFFICDYLIKDGVKIVLSGGACVAIYTNHKSMSYDLDFVLISTEGRKRIKQLLLAIGFYEEDMFFKHKETRYFLHFLPPPLSIGDELVKKTNKIKRGGRTLELLSPTDCVKDRLAAYYHWDDRQSLDQAVMVAQDNRVNISEVKRWSIKESHYEKFRTFLRALKTRQ